MMIPNKLQKGQVIGCYSPSASLEADRTRVMLFNRGIKKLQDFGFRIKEGNCTRKQYFHMSASAQERAAEIHDLFLNPEVSAVFPTIGGHCASQILPYLDTNIIRENPKIFVSFSDSALLGMYITSKTGLITYHSAVDIVFGFSRFGTEECPMQNNGLYTQQNLLATLEHRQPSIKPFSTWIGLKNGEARGKLIGGNIKGINSLIGTPFEPDWENTILYWEAKDSLHVIAQALTQLKNSGVLNYVSGMIVGKVATNKEIFYRKEEIMPIHDFIKYTLEGINIPVAVEADIGHDIENITIPNGCNGHLNIENGKAFFSIEYQ